MTLYRRGTQRQVGDVREEVNAAGPARQPGDHREGVDELGVVGMVLDADELQAGGVGSSCHSPESLSGNSLTRRDVLGLWLRRSS